MTFKWIVTQPIDNEEKLLLGRVTGIRETEPAPKIKALLSQYTLAVQEQDSTFKLYFTLNRVKPKFPGKLKQASEDNLEEVICKRRGDILQLPLPRVNPLTSIEAVRRYAIDNLVRVTHHSWYNTPRTVILIEEERIAK